MSDKNPCPFCGNEAEYLRFLDLCAERANEKWRENEVKTMIDVYTSMDFVQVVRCRDCKHFTYADAVHGDDDWCAKHSHIGWSVNGFCAWAERREP